MGVGSCAKVMGEATKSCANGCEKEECCAVTKQSLNAHHCLSQLLKRLDGEIKSEDACGYCNRHLKVDHGV